MSARTIGATLVILTVAALAAWWVLVRVETPHRNQPAVVRGSGDRITIAAAGDSLIGRPLPRPGTDSGFDDVVRILSDASFAFTNLEENLLEALTPPIDRTREAPLWPHGSRLTADALRSAGFTLISCGNNHAIDYGVAGMTGTLALFEAAGLWHAGCGAELSQARAPAVVGTRPRAVAVVAMTTSAAAESRATSTHGDIRGRPGVSALRYSADIMVDPATFATLRQAMAGMPGASTSGETELVIAGNAIKKGARTIVTVSADTRDELDILAQIKSARSTADIVLVSIHSHEPANQDPTPAPFVREFAHKAIDSGADLVIGHGPHQVRGIERYGRGAIFYSVGNFVFDESEIDSRSMDIYEAGADLYRVALGAIGPEGARPGPVRDEAIWLESIIPVATFQRGVLTSIRLQPIDLGVDLPKAQRGTPRIAAPARAHEILKRLAQLSVAFGTEIREEAGAGFIDLPDPGRQ